MVLAVSKFKSRVLMTVLLASVACAPAAFAAGGGSKSGGSDKSPKTETSANMKAYTDAIAKARTNNETIKAQVAALRQKVQEIVVAPVFDKAAFISKSNEIEALNAKMNKSITDAAANALTKFSTEERKMLASSVKSSGEKGGASSAKGGASKAKKHTSKAKKKPAEKGGKSKSSKSKHHGSKKSSKKKK